jgi:anti-anti-sigma factor
VRHFPIKRCILARQIVRHRVRRRAIPEQLTLTVSLRGTREVKDNYQLFRLTGLLDAFSEAAFRKVIAKCVDDGVKNVILDLSQIDLMDSSGLGAIVQVSKKVTSSEGVLQIVTNARVTQTLKLVKLDKVFSLHPDLASAVEAFKS